MNTRLFLFMLLTLGSLAFGRDIEVKSGNFAYFGVEMPSSIIAGEDRKVILTAYDAYDNKTNYFGNIERTFTLKVSGSATLDKQRFTPDDFESGSVTVTLSDRNAESVSISFYENDRPLLVKNMATVLFAPHFNVKVEYAPLGSFDLAAAEELIAGEAFKVNLTAKDTQGNIITDYSNIAQGVRLVAEGKGGKKSLLVPADLFSDGRAELLFRYDFPGTVRITATDISNAKATGSTGGLTFEAQTLSRIEVTAPSSIRAGAPFVVKLKAINQFDRVMQNYAAVGGDVLLRTNGSGRLIPDRLPASAFVQGLAIFETLYTKPEPITITAVAAEDTVSSPAHAAAKPAKPSKVKKTKKEVAKAAPVPAEKSASFPAIEQEVIKGESKQKVAEKDAGFLLSLLFDQKLGKIERIDTEYKKSGKLGITYISILFEKGKTIKRIKPISKEITAEGRIIGILSLDGILDNEGHLTVEIKENEPFTVDVKHANNKLKLHFLLNA